MNKSKQFSSEVRERAVRLVQEHRGEYPSLWAAVESIAPKIGCVPSTLLAWVKRAEIDAGQRSGMSTAEAPLYQFISAADINQPLQYPGRFNALAGTSGFRV